jgi:hypothetical protein
MLELGKKKLGCFKKPASIDPGECGADSLQLACLQSQCKAFRSNSEFQVDGKIQIANQPKKPAKLARH